MKNIGNIMKQAQQMQAKMNQLQESLGQMTVEGKAGGGLVGVVATCRGEIKGLKIDPSLLDPQEVEVLEDLIMAAINDARTKADAKAAEEMSKITSGMNLPAGLGLPF
ncbi:MAG: YbaB/EbfC family nucleoid-associated protein [Alphaproteobacteria bacterium]|nr:YbaB/EbfC family nucleoid-associated protein [Alphaproteobacteria bacterium]